KCSICNKGYYPKTFGDYKCQKCDSTCLTCDNQSGICSQCAPGYTPFKEKSIQCQLCQDFDVNCGKCNTTASECLLCSTNKYPDDVNKKCVECDHSCGGNCNGTTGMCLSCETNYVFTQPISRKCESCQTFDINCEYCEPDFTRKCLVCLDGFYLDATNHTCEPCNSIPNCSECDTNGICITCQLNNVFVDTKPPSCIACNQYYPKCISCSQDVSSKCTECEYGFYPNSTGYCVECDLFCNKKCNSSTGYCDSCLTNNVFTEPKSFICETCNQFDVNCAICSSTFERKCEMCNTGMFKIQYGNEVICKSCDLTCNHQCNSDDGHCLECLENYIFSEANLLQCESCNDFDNNCERCASDYSRKCVECKNGYYLVDGKCVQCDSTCGGSCDMMNGYCTSCRSNMVFSTTNKSVCILCDAFDANCLKCSESGERKCITCTNKKYPDKSGLCVNCPTSCTTSCDGSTGVCTICVNNYVQETMNESMCVKCSDFDKNCLMCASNTSRNCVQCLTNYYPVQQPNGEKTCESCDLTCGGKCNTETGYCIGCEYNYVLISPTNLKCQTCKEFDINCKYCASDFTRKCIECEPNYYPASNGTCILCSMSCNEKCNSISGLCERCIENYVVNNPKSNECQSCTSFDSKCDKCASDYTRKCIVCQSGYFTNEDADFKCQKCDPTC
ncbi:hypothetical protein EIN_099610, partial [Entamoeba invadens IP1]